MPEFTRGEVVLWESEVDRKPVEWTVKAVHVMPKVGQVLTLGKGRLGPNSTKLGAEFIVRASEVKARGAAE